jgi:hypothetical protein
MISLARAIGGAGVVMVWAAIPAGAAGTNILTLGGSPYTQDFDSMGTGSTQPPLGWNAGTLGASTSDGVIANVASLSASTGNSTTAGNFNYGSTGDSDRAIGSLASGTGGTRATQALFLNDTGLTLTNLTILYDGEQWRDGGTSTAVDQLTLYFSQATVGGLTNFTAVGASFNFVVPKNTSTAGSLNGNLAVNRVAGIGGDFAVNIAPGEVFALRWVDLDTAGNDDAMAIDNFSLGYAVIPEPSTLTLVAAGLLGALACRRRRKGPFAP